MGSYPLLVSTFKSSHQYQEYNNPYKIRSSHRRLKVASAFIKCSTLDEAVPQGIQNISKWCPKSVNRDADMPISLQENPLLASILLV